MTHDRFFSAEAMAFRPSPIRRLAPLIADPSILSFAGGVPAAETFPVERIAEIAARLLREKPGVVLQYQPTWGPPPLREWIRSRLGRLGVAVPENGVLVTTGSQQALDLVARVLLDPGDVLFVELPSYIGALAAFHARRARLVGIPPDGAGGWDLPALAVRIRSLRAEGATIRGIYAIPNFQNPAGTSIPATQRPEIAEFVAEHDLLLVEDDPYGELSYSEVDTTPIAAFDRSSRILHLGSFSKVLAPALRTAWIAGPAPLVAKCELAKQAADLCSPSLDQWIVSEFVNAGLLEPQIERAREHYRGRRATLLEALERELPAGCRFTRSEGGLFSFVELPEGCGIDTAALLEVSLAEDRVAFIPGAPFFVEGDGSRTLRLTFAKENDDRIREGIGLLGRRIHASTERAPA